MGLALVGVAVFLPAVAQSSVKINFRAFISSFFKPLLRSFPSPCGFHCLSPCCLGHPTGLLLPWVWAGLSSGHSAGLHAPRPSRLPSSRPWGFPHLDGRGRPARVHTHPSCPDPSPPGLRAAALLNVRLFVCLPQTRPGRLSPAELSPVRVPHGSGADPSVSLV